MTRPERRARIYWLPDWAVWDLFTARWALPDFITLHFLDGVPPDCEVESVFYAPERRAFGFRLIHPSFDPVPSGAHPPDFGEVRYESVRVNKDHEAGLPAYAALRQDADGLRRAYEQGREEEREACARIADDGLSNCAIATAIRAEATP